MIIIYTLNLYTKKYNNIIAYSEKKWDEVTRKVVPDLNLHLPIKCMAMIGIFAL